MPVFKVTVREEITRRTVAYVDAPDKAQADAWACQASASLFRDAGNENIFAEVERIDVIGAAPDGWEICSATANPPETPDLRSRAR